MPAPLVATYSADAIIAAHQSFVDLIDGGAGNGKVFVRSAADVLLAEVPLDGPAGVVNGTTGQITFDFTGPDTSADATGTVAYVEFADSDNVVHLSVPAVQGASAVSGYAVFNTLEVLSGYPVTIISATIG